MKRFQIKPFLIAAVSAGLLFSCDTDTDETIDQATNVPTTADLRIAAQTDNIEDNSFAVVENAYVESEEPGRAPQMTSFFPDCATITINPNGDGSGTIDLAFTDGCTLNNGAVVSGGATINYTVPQSGTRTVTYTYNEFVYNGNPVSGGGTVIRTFENANGNPQSELDAAIEVTFVADDVVATRTVNRTREWIEGVGSGTWTDNVFSVTGSWNTNFSSGFTRTGTVIEPLRREASCTNFVSGSLDIEQNNVDAVLDFGDGACDNIAVVTVFGQDYTIQL